MRKLLFISFLLVSTAGFSEQAVIHGGHSRTIDSLTTRLQENLHDTDRVTTLNQLAWQLKNSNLDTAIILSSEALTIAEAQKWQIGISNSYNKLGTFNWTMGDYAEALNNYSKSLKVNKEMGRRSGIAANLTNIGGVYYNQGNYPKALESLFTALKMSEELINSADPNIARASEKRVSAILNNIGLVYEYQAEYSKALEYYLKSLDLAEDLGDKSYISANLGNIGIVYLERGDNPKALEYFFKALYLDKELGNKIGASRHLGNIGITYLRQGDSAMAHGEAKVAVEYKYSLALEYLSKALSTARELGDKNAVGRHLGNIGFLHFTLGDFGKAEETFKSAISHSQAIGARENLKYQYKNLSDSYDSVGDPARAFETYKLYIIVSDSISNEENTKAQTRTEMKYEYEKAELVKKQEEREAARIQAESLSRRDNLQYSVILLGLLVLGSLVLGLGKLSLPVRMAEGLIFFSFLILFEFILVLADPYIEGWSGGAPGIKLLFNAGIAALIFPLHSLFESKLKSRLAK